MMQALLVLGSPPVLPRHSHSQVLSSFQRAAVCFSVHRSPDCTPLRSVCLGLLRLCAAGTQWPHSGTTQGRMQCVSTDNATLRYIGRLLMNIAGSTHRRLANGGVKKSARTSVKNGELSEDERNAVKLIKFFAV